MLGVTLLSTAVLAQTGNNNYSAPADAYLVKYFANLTALNGGGNLINLTNAGSTGGSDSTDSLCANVYVFDELQELISCCYCPLSPNELATINVESGLVASPNSLTPYDPPGVTVGLVATNANAMGGAACNPSVINPSNLASGLRAWGTTVHIAGGTTFLTETEFSQVPLTNGSSHNATDQFTELDKMTSFCGFIQQDGTFYGQCTQCANTTQGAAKQ